MIPVPLPAVSICHIDSLHFLSLCCRCIETSATFKTAAGAGYTNWGGTACYKMSCSAGALKVRY